MEPKMLKAGLRKTLPEQRDNMPHEEKARKDAGICLRLDALIRERNAKVIHTYLPFGSEIDIYPLIQDLLDRGLTVVCPKALPKKELENLVLHSLDELEEGKFGTKHPAGGTVYNGHIDLFIVPGLGFDKKGHRLGYGAGYYDRFFAGRPQGYKVGICYPFQMMDDFPTEAHDVPLDQILY